MPSIEILTTDCLEALQQVPDNSLDACVTDPPYGLSDHSEQDVRDCLKAWLNGEPYRPKSKGFMCHQWDAWVPGPEIWREVYRTLKPGAYLACFASTRTADLMSMAIRLAGFRKQQDLSWIFGCLSDDTEILVDGRWEPYHKAIAGKSALCYSVRTNTLTWQPIEELYVYDYTDTAYRIVSDSTDQLVTRNHRCLVERGGSLVFATAETLERQVRVPVLEDMPGLLETFSRHATRTCEDGKVLQSKVFWGAAKDTEEKAVVGTQVDACLMRGMRKEGVEAECLDETNKDNGVFMQVQWGDSRSRMEEARTQGPSGMDRRKPSILPVEDDGVKESSLEGRCDVLPQARQLQADQVRPVPGGVPADGPQGRLCNGTPLAGCAGDRAMPDSEGSCASQKPRPAGQPAGESGVVCQQSGSQEVRASWNAATTLAVVTLVEYSGVVWCVRVPTGAFVARRNGKVFITGNSGFPKATNASKMIDKAAGAEREVVGINEDYLRRKPNGMMTDGATAYGYPQSQQETDARITAPATEAAKRWDEHFYGLQAIKPAHESILLFSKPFTEPEPIAVVLLSVYLSLKELLCLTSRAVGVDWSFISRLRKPSGVSTSAQWLASETASQRSVDIAGVNFTLNHPRDLLRSFAADAAQTPGEKNESDTLVSSRKDIGTSQTLTEGERTLLSIVTLWNDTLDACSKAMSTFTTSMETGWITALKILSCVASDSISKTTILPSDNHPGGLLCAATTVENSLRILFHALAVRNCIFAAESAIGSAAKKAKGQAGVEMDPILLFQKPHEGRPVDSILKWGCGALNVGACRIATAANEPDSGVMYYRNRGLPMPENRQNYFGGKDQTVKSQPIAGGRWPATILLSHVPDAPCPVCNPNELESVERPEDCPACGGGGWVLGCRRVGTKRVQVAWSQPMERTTSDPGMFKGKKQDRPVGHADPDGLETVDNWECVEGCPCGMFPQTTSGALTRSETAMAEAGKHGIYGRFRGTPDGRHFDGSAGSASRFFYQAKASRRERAFYCRDCRAAFWAKDREGHQHGHVDEKGDPTWGHLVQHPTVKPQALMSWIARLVTPKGGTVLDPFLGTGTTAVACRQEGFSCLGMEQDPEYAEIARMRAGAPPNDAKPTPAKRPGRTPVRPRPANGQKTLF